MSGFKTTGAKVKDDERSPPSYEDFKLVGLLPLPEPPDIIPPFEILIAEFDRFNPEPRSNPVIYNKSTSLRSLLLEFVREKFKKGTIKDER